MRRLLKILKWPVIVVAVIWGVGALLDWIGPTETISLPSGFDAAQIGEDASAWLAAQEAAVPNLRPEAVKRIVWAGDPGVETPLALVYLHGFSASAEEIRPVPELMATALGANLFYARLTGHGRDSAAMGEITAQALVDDAAEAMAIGRLLGERVIVLGVSTGGTLGVIAASDPDMSQDLAGIIAMSPNFRMKGLGGRVAEWPFARIWGPWVAGAERSAEPVNDAHAKFWTTTYPTASIAALGAVVHEARNLDFAAMTVPALFMVSASDTVVDPGTTRRIAARWGAPSQLVPVPMGPNEDPSGHVLAGDAMSPARTMPVAERLIAWARQL